MSLFLAIIPLLLGAAAINLLYLSFKETGRAGLTRFKSIEGRSQRFLPWVGRWDRLVHSFLVTSILTQTLASAFIGLCLFSLWDQNPATILPMGIGFMLSFLLVVHSLPRALAANASDLISRHALPWAKVIYRMIGPLTAPLFWLETQMIKSVQHRPSTVKKSNAGAAAHHSAEEEILSLIANSSDHDIEDDEAEMIKGALMLDQTSAEEIMTPRVGTVSFEDTLMLKEVIHEIAQAPYSRFPIYNERIDNVTGMIHVRDIFRAYINDDHDLTLLDLSKTTIFVPEKMPIDELLAKLRREKTQAAIVVDEYGGTAGFVSVEDIIEELVGEIEDEHDHEEFRMREIGNDIWIVDAHLGVFELNDTLELDIPESEEYNSIGGFVFYELGRIPERGDVLATRTCIIKIHESTERALITLEIDKNVAKIDSNSKGKEEDPGDVILPEDTAPPLLS